MQIEYIKVSDLKPYENNPRKNESSVGKVAESIQEFGFKVPIVLDTFGGSGTTIMACEQDGRKGYAMEIDPKYVDVIIDRWEKFTGNKAVKLEG